MRFPPSFRGTFQRTFEDYGLDLGVPGDFVTITRDPFESNVHRNESPASTPRTSTTVDGTVVRSEADRSMAFTSFDSMGFGKGSSPIDGTPVDVSCGQHVRQHVGSPKYLRHVCQHVGQRMIDLAPRMVTREVRALEMLQADSRVAKVLGSPGEYVVPSQSGRGLYRVKIGSESGAPDTCTCPDFEERRAACKHIYLVRFDLRAEDEESPPPKESRVPSPPVSPKRDWSIYNESQTEEYRLFNTLLRDLSIGFPEPWVDPHRAGRKPIPLREQAFCAVQRAFLGFSLRRSHGFRAEAARNGLLSKAPFWAAPSRFLCRPDVTEGLHDMLARSAIPLIGLEDRCAVDSTGLRTSQFNYYRHEKYEPSRENVWLKLHALVGVKTHVMPVLEVTAGSANDSPQFPVLLKRAVANGFHFKEVYADKGYQSRVNFNTADQLEILPFIPFRSNQTGKSAGSPLYHKMFLFFQYKRDEFDVHYGQRAQVESTFGAFKQKFGETLASRNFTAQLNEVLSLAIAHNISVLVRQMFEAGILPDFLHPPEGTGSPSVLRQPAEVSTALSPNRSGAEPAVTLSAASR